MSTTIVKDRGSMSREDSKIASLLNLRPGFVEEYYNAKAFLCKTSPLSNLSIYDHLTEVIGNIIDTRQEDAVEYFEDISLWIKRTKLNYQEDTLIDKDEESTKLIQAEKEKILFQVTGEGEEDEDNPEPIDEESIVPNIQELIFYFEQANISMSRDEVIKVMLALKSLVNSTGLIKVRFWGKIIGTEKNYYIAETDNKPGDETDEEEEGEPLEEDEDESKDEVEEEEEEEEEEDDEGIIIRQPKSKYKPPIVIPAEPAKVGSNKKLYFVCNEPGTPWTKLPNVTPAQIATARKIVKYFTGRLDAPVLCYPPFPGKEMHYLRAQIARISASTHIAPLGFYNFGEEEEAESEEGGRGGYVENKDYEPLSVTDLVDPSLDNWVHFSMYLLPQGRCIWFNPKQAREEEEAEEAEEEREMDEETTIEPEIGPPLLSPLSEDTAIDGFQLWTTRSSSKLFPQTAIASIYSNLWPGAHAFAFQRKFANIYIGYGVKFSLQTHNPAPPPKIMSEYPTGSEIIETVDPTPEEEAEFRQAQEEEMEEEDIEPEEDES